MITTELKQQFSEILEQLGKTLDITKEQHDAAVTSYQFVGDWLSKPDSSLAIYNPEILPQGGFLFGTITKPVNENDELDIDLVCRLEGKHPDWTQYHLKQVVGDRLKAHGTLKKLLDEEGRRCWTLRYAESAKFHLDALPSIVSVGYRNILEKAFSVSDFKEAASLAIRITDKEAWNYHSSTNPQEWGISNPFGLAAWFYQQAAIQIIKAYNLMEAVMPVPKYQKEKLPLQRIVQIMKRHRDIMFDGDCDKPISIIITTLAAKAYQKQTDITTGLLEVLDRMPDFIEQRYSPQHQRMIKWIPNPVNDQENFADRWADYPKKEINFYNWMRQIKIDLEAAMQQQGKGINKVQEAMENPFGRDTIKKAFSNYGEQFLSQRENNELRMAERTGILSASGRTPVPQHNNFGTNE